MSNLIKSVYFNVQTSPEKHAIDSNERLKELLPQLSPVEEAAFRPLSLEAQTIEDTEGLEIYSGEEAKSMDDGDEPSVEEELEASRYIEEAKAQAEQILQEANDAAEVIRNQAYEEGKNQGYSDGMAGALGKLKEKEQELAEERAKMEKEYQQQLDSLEPAFIDILIQLMHKLTGIMVEDKKDVLIFLIDQAIRQLEKPESILLRISKEDMVMVMSHIRELKAAVAEGVEFDVVEEVTLGKNQCIIEAGDRMFDCSLDAQMENLTEQLKLLSYS